MVGSKRNAVSGSESPGESVGQRSLYIAETTCHRVLQFAMPAERSSGARRLKVWANNLHIFNKTNEELSRSVQHQEAAKMHNSVFSNIIAYDYRFMRPIHTKVKPRQGSYYLLAFFAFCMQENPWVGMR
jgi:hypothetical protein